LKDKKQVDASRYAAGSASIEALKVDSEAIRL
jgi:hypothetical protein